MRRFAFERFAQKTEEMVRKAVNSDGIEKAQEKLLQAICDADDMFTSRQLRRLFAYAFRV